MGTIQTSSTNPLKTRDLFWALGSLCALNRIPFDEQLLQSRFSPPYDSDTLIQAGRELGFRVKESTPSESNIHQLLTPCLLLMRKVDGAQNELITLHLVAAVDGDQLTCFTCDDPQPRTVSLSESIQTQAISLFLFSREPETVADPDVTDRNAFGFRWFVPELLRHKRVWRDVLLSSLAIQLLALGMPLFTQVIIDKVVVHHTRSTLMVIAFGMALFLIFTSALGWIRQYLVLHTGNRVDAVLPLLSSITCSSCRHAISNAGLLV